MFNAAGVCALLLDLLVVSDGGARGSKAAAYWTVVWITVSLMFCAHLYFAYNEEVAVNFLTGYVIEYSLSCVPRSTHSCDALCSLRSNKRAQSSEISKRRFHAAGAAWTTSLSSF
jgi:hypothetical protein